MKRERRKNEIFSSFSLLGGGCFLNQSVNKLGAYGTFLYLVLSLIFHQLIFHLTE